MRQPGLGLAGRAPKIRYGDLLHTNNRKKRISRFAPYLKDTIRETRTFFNVKIYPHFAQASFIILKAGLETAYRGTSLIRKCGAPLGSP